MKKRIDVGIRWLVNHDHPEVLAIEHQTAESPWDGEAMNEVLRGRNVIGMVAHDQDRIVGFMIYEMEPTRINVLRFAVDEFARRLGVGTVMMDKLKRKLDPVKRQSLWFDVPDTNTVAHLFLRANGLTATMQRAEKPGERDTYRFRWVETRAPAPQTVDDLTFSMSPEVA